MYCSRCQKNRTWIRRSDQTNGEAVFLGIVTLGISAALRQFWWRCMHCNKVIEE